MATFNNKYVGSSFKPALVKKVGNEARNIRAAESSNYSLQEQLLNNPAVKEFSIKLSSDEINMDFRTPVYIEKFGGHCMVLNIIATKTGWSRVKVLLINKTLV